MLYEVITPAEVLHGKPVLIERGSFRPVTNATLAILDRARSAFQKATAGAFGEPVALMEMTFDNLLDRTRRVDHDDFLIRAQMLGAVGQSALVSSYGPFYPLSGYLV